MDLAVPIWKICQNASRFYRFYLLDMYAMEPIDYGKSEEKGKTKSVKLHFFLK